RHHRLSGLDLVAVIEGGRLCSLGVDEGPITAAQVGETAQFWLNVHEEVQPRAAVVLGKAEIRLRGSANQESAAPVEAEGVAPMGPGTHRQEDGQGAIPPFRLFTQGSGGIIVAARHEATTENRPCLSSFAARIPAAIRSSTSVRM